MLGGEWVHVPSNKAHDHNLSLSWSLGKPNTVLYCIFPLAVLLYFGGTDRYQLLLAKE